MQTFQLNKSGALSLMFLAIAGVACCQSAGHQDNGAASLSPPETQNTGDSMTEASDTSAESGASVSGLPHAGDKSFATLDAYLAYLKTRGTYGVPFYEETEPGLYRLVTGRRPPGAPPEVTCTRDQLKKMFGFTE